MKKKLITLLTTITILLLFGAVSANAEFVESGSCGENVTYTLNDEGTLTISGTGEMDDYVGNGSPFCNNLSIKTVVIENGITSLGNNMFRNCSDLISVTISDSVTSIGDYAFMYCSGLTSVTIPDSVTSIGDYAFGICNSLPRITIPNSVTSIGDYAFSDCGNLTSITIPNSVTSISYTSFQRCKSITAINVDEKNKNYSSIDGVLFNKNKTKLIQYPIGNKRTTYSIPNSVTSIGDGAFEGCSSLLSVNILDNVTSIGNYAFSNCGNLTSITVPDSVRSIGRSAFYSCRNITNITIGDSITCIGSSTFSDTAYYNDSSNWENGVLYIGKHLVQAKNDDLPNTYIIKNDTKTISDRAFQNCSGLTSITIPDSVTRIGGYAFHYCKNLSSVTIGNGVTTIDNFAFIGCESLTNITIPDSVTAIGASAFAMTGLTNVYIPQNVSNLGQYVFSNCKSLKSINVDNLNANYCSIDGNLFSKDKTILYQYSSGKTESEYTIPHGVKKADSSPFQYSSLKTIIIPYGMTDIYDIALSYCDELENVVIPDSVKSMSLQAICYNCKNLKNIYYSGTEDQWEAIQIATMNDMINNATIHYNATYYVSDNITPEKPVIIKSDDENHYYFTVGIEHPYAECVIYIALSDENHNLLSVEEQPLKLFEDNIVEIDKENSVTDAKIFVWTDNMQPITAAENIDLN